VKKKSQRIILALKKSNTNKNTRRNVERLEGINKSLTRQFPALKHLFSQKINDQNPVTSNHEDITTKFKHN
jgi:hypothetical protein